MIIKKNMDVKIDIDSEIVSEYFKSCAGNTKEIMSLASAMDETTLTYLTTYYLAKLYDEDRNKYNKFVNTVKEEVEDEKQIEVGNLYKMKNPKDFLFINTTTVNPIQVTEITEDSISYSLFTQELDIKSARIKVGYRMYRPTFESYIKSGDLTLLE